MGLFSDIFGGGRYKTIRVSGSTNPLFGKSVNEKAMEAIDDMNSQGYELVEKVLEQGANNWGMTTVTYVLTFARRN